MADIIKQVGYGVLTSRAGLRASSLGYAGGGGKYVFLKKGEIIFHCFDKSQPMIKQQQH